MLSAVTSLIFQKKLACLNRGAALSSSPFHNPTLGCGAPATGCVRPEDVRRRGKVKHSAAGRGLYVHYVLIMCRPLSPREQCLPLEKHWLTFAPVRRILNEGRQRGGIEKRSHLSIMRLKEEKKKEDDFSSRVAFAACLGLISLHFSSLLIKTKACMLGESVKKW